MPAPTANRPFFSNFLAAFRAHQSVHHAVKSASSTALTGSTTAQSSTHRTTTTSSDTPSQQTRTVVTTSKPSQTQQSALSPSSTVPNQAVPQTTTMAISNHHTFQPHRHHHSVSPYSRSPGSVSPVGSSPGFAQTQRGRRGSDSSNEGGFRDVSRASAGGGGEKWYIGGRTAAGEERFYKLSMVKRPRSLDRLSADRMSL